MTETADTYYAADYDTDYKRPIFLQKIPKNY